MKPNLKKLAGTVLTGAFILGTAGMAGAQTIWGGTSPNATLLSPYTKVGIGTSSPITSLHVNGADNTGRVAYFQSAGFNSFLEVNAPFNAAYNPMVLQGDNGIFWNDGTGNTSNGFVIGPWNAYTKGIRIDATLGNITSGFGQYTAITMGSAEFSTLNYGTAYLGINVSRSVVSGSNVWTTLTDNSHNGANLIYGDVIGDLRFVTIPNTGTTSQQLGDAAILTNTTMYINSQGQVCIGPAAGNMLTPGPYKLYVAGGILTEQVKVGLQNTTNWADYVFADKYKLKPLGEVEQYVKEFKHLPGVPSAQEVKDNGIDVAEMDATLLKKIEELTLYTIELNKKLEEQNKQLEALKKK
jgi:hypothetical protein